jgi:hypothetical protein
MVIYSVTIFLRREIESDWSDWMQRVHIPDVLATGCFTECRMHKVLDAAEPTYVMQYACHTMADYERYRDSFAPKLQKEHTERYDGKFRGERQLLEVVAQFP